ncbi:4'-phosphopantetheinyl transferase family protein [Acetobacterium bakii]|uniref:4'-phosphopantetheinyl transferase family protein n=1 Tax=Acetobacterium bakii TaxID=52689 RepID=UPI0006821918|nr:4'-phosphopantetheinyl transferase superfamily protein [Acetobacterium bakii]
MNEFKTQIFIADTMPLQNPKILQKYLDQVTTERREKVVRQKSIQSQALSLGAEVLMKKAMLKSFGIKGNLIIEKSEQGKPRLLKHSGIHYNLSHSGNYVVCALSNKAVGLDLQKMDRLNLDLATRYFAQEEVVWLFDLPVEKQKKGFFDLWTIKESYMKFTGRGFALPMSSFTVRLEGKLLDAGGVSIFEGEEKVSVFLKEYKCPENYVLWCCSSSSNFEEVLEWMDLEGDLI